MVVLVLTAAASAGAIAAWMLDRRRCRRRNMAGRCASCGTPWADEESGDAYLIHGRFVCESCAAKARRRMPWELAGLAAWAAVGTASAFAALATGSGAEIGFVVAVAAAAVVVPVGAVRIMKLANRRAQRRMASGELSDFPALGGAVAADMSAPKTETAARDL